MFTPSPYCNIYIEYSCILFFVGEESFCLVGDVEVDSIILLVIKWPSVLGLCHQRHECGYRSKLVLEGWPHALSQRGFILC